MSLTLSLLLATAVPVLHLSLEECEKRYAGDHRRILECAGADLSDPAFQEAKRRIKVCSELKAKAAESGIVIRAIQFDVDGEPGECKFQDAKSD